MQNNPRKYITTIKHIKSKVHIFQLIYNNSFISKTYIYEDEQMYVTFGLHELYNHIIPYVEQEIEQMSDPELIIELHRDQELRKITMLNNSLEAFQNIKQNKLFSNLKLDYFDVENFFLDYFDLIMFIDYRINKLPTYTSNFPKHIKNTNKLFRNFINKTYKPKQER